VSLLGHSSMVGREGPTSQAVGVARSGRRDGRRCTRRSEQRCVCRTSQGMGQVRVGGLRVTTGLGKGVDAGGNRWSVVSSVILQCTPSPPTTINTQRLTRGRGGLCHGSSSHWLASSTGCPQGPPSWTSAAAQGITRAPSPSTVLTLSVPASTFPSPCSARQRRVRRERGSSLAMRRGPSRAGTASLDWHSLWTSFTTSSGSPHSLWKPHACSPRAAASCSLPTRRTTFADAA